MATHQEEETKRARLIREAAVRRLTTGEGRQSIFIYVPGLMDRSDPRVLAGVPIQRGEGVVIVKDDIDPLHKIVWIIDKDGNEQSVWRTSLTPVSRRLLGESTSRRPEVHVGGYRRSIVDRFGHRIRVPKWPSEAGLSKLRGHTKRVHPRAFAASIRKGVATRARRLRR